MSTTTPTTITQERDWATHWKMRYFEAFAELGKANRGLRRLRVKADRVPRWRKITDDCRPPVDQIVWLWDGQCVWLGGRADDCDGWLWGNTYGRVWFNGRKWDGDLATDDDYKPTHWMALPTPPKVGGFSSTTTTNQNQTKP